MRDAVGDARRPKGEHVLSGISLATSSADSTPRSDIHLGPASDMTPRRAGRDPRQPNDHEAPLGLRLRLWIGCLGGALVAGTGIWVVMGTQTGPSSQINPGALVAWLLGVAGLGVVVGGTLALWLSHVILTHLRGLS